MPGGESQPTTRYAHDFRMGSSTEPLAPATLRYRVDPVSGELLARDWRLLVLSGADTGRELPLDVRTVLGSDTEATVSLADSAISRRHVELEPRADGVRLRDLGSKNGTFLAGTRVTELLLEEGATFKIGRTVLKLQSRDRTVGTASAEVSFGKARGESRVMRELFGMLLRVAQSDTSVVLLGETGTGKDLLAEGIHLASPRRERPFVVVDCASIVPELVESELFGHVRGAFTDAVQDRAGAFQAADGGTVFLDEVGELPRELQPKLLRVLEQGRVKRVGEDRYRSVDVRVVAATHRDLEAEARADRFREDLYFRLAVVPVRVPPLRERLEDVPVLTREFVQQLQRPDFALSEELLARLQHHAWPGNVRELRNVVERALAGLEPELGAPAALASGLPTEDVSQLPFKAAKERLVESFAREYLEALARRCEGNVSRMAREAGLARTHVHLLLQRYGLRSAEEGDEGAPLRGPQRPKTRTS